MYKGDLYLYLYHTTRTNAPISNLLALKDQLDNGHERFKYAKLYFMLGFVRLYSFLRRFFLRSHKKP